MHFQMARPGYHICAGMEMLGLTQEKYTVHCDLSWCAYLEYWRLKTRNGLLSHTIDFEICLMGDSEIVVQKNDMVIFLF